MGTSGLSGGIEDFLSELERLCPSGRELRRRRRLKTLNGVACSFCVLSDRPWNDMRISKYLPKCESWESWVSYYWPRRAVYERIAQGGLGIDDKLGVWNSGFWHGLRLSGALRRGPATSTEWYVWEKSHAALVADLAELPIPGRLEPRPSPSGLRRLRRCPASFLPPENPRSPSVLAGLFAGAGLEEIGGETWVGLPAADEVAALLKEWHINFSFANGRFRGSIRVSARISHLPAADCGSWVVCYARTRSGDSRVL